MNIREKFYCSKCLHQLDDEMVCPYCGYDPSSPRSYRFLEEGTLLNDQRYLIGAVVGSGGFGITYAGWDLLLDGPVAIKEYYPSSICDRNNDEIQDVIVPEDKKQEFLIGLARFKREARILVSLQNIPNIVSVLDCFDANNTAYIVMEYVRGIPIDAYVHSKNLNTADVFKMFRGLIDSLVLIHETGVYHRDISPGNILVQEDGTVRLIDFGSASTSERRNEGKDKTIIYKHHFSPIEQYDKEEMQGPWTDVYALSATIYYLITGELPQTSESRVNNDTIHDIPAANGNLTKRQIKALMGGLAVSPQKRIRSMEIFRSILYNLPMPEEVQRQRAFMRKVISVAVAAFLVMTIILLNFTHGFSYGDALRYSLHGDGFHITGFEKTDAAIVVPEKKASINVCSIDEGAFSASPLREIQIPESVKTIQNRAFSGCVDLETVDIREGTDSIGDLAFQDCTKLNTVILPNSISHIGENVFSGCSDQLTVWCEKDSGCYDSLLSENIRVASMNDYETEEVESGVAITTFNNVFTDSDGLYSIPDYINGVQVTELYMPNSDGKTPMFNNQISSIELPEHLHRLGDGVFCNLTKLKTLIIGQELNEIGDCALRYCGIESLELPNSLKKIGEKSITGTFLKTLVIPDSVSDVGDSAFATNTLLESVTLSNGMEEIPGGAFEGDTSLTFVDFNKTKSLKRVKMLAFSKCRSLEIIELPDGVETIELNAFSDCIKLKAIYIPPSVTEIALSAFEGCPNDLIIIGEGGTYANEFALQQEYDFMDISQYKEYQSRINVESGSLLWDESEAEDVIHLPSAYKGEGSVIIKNLVDARNLKSRIVYLPHFLEKISYPAFAHNSYVSEIHGYDRYGYSSVEEIGTIAFYQCENLKVLSGISQLKSIEKYAFAEAVSLEESLLPDSLEYLGDYAYWKCSKVNSINIPQGIIQLYDGVFAETGITDLVIPGNVVKCRTAFYGCNELQNVTIETGTKVLMGTFANCSNLESISIPSSMERISQSTFKGCSSLKDVYVYSDDVNLDFKWSPTQYIKSIEIDNGEAKPLQIEKLEELGDTTSFLFSDSHDVTIHGYEGSTAQAFAKEHGIKFELINEFEDLQQQYDAIKQNISPDIQRSPINF